MEHVVCILSDVCFCLSWMLLSFVLHTCRQDNRVDSIFIEFYCLCMHVFLCCMTFVVHACSSRFLLWRHLNRPPNGVCYNLTGTCSRPKAMQSVLTRAAYEYYMSDIRSRVGGKCNNKGTCGSFERLDCANVLCIVLLASLL